MAKEAMLQRTSIPEAPWWVVPAVDKKKARLNCLSHFLSLLPYTGIPHDPVILPSRRHRDDYHRHPVPEEMIVPQKF
jgi:hypothetical protein